MSLGLVVVAYLSLGPLLARQSDTPAATLPALMRVDLTVRVDYDGGRLVGRARLGIRGRSPASAQSIPLVLNRLMRVTGVQDAANRRLPYHQRVAAFDDLETFQVNAISVDLARPLRTGEEVEIDIGYEGPLVGYTEVGMRYVRDHISRDFTILREDALAFPVLGGLSLAGNRAAPREDFSFAAAVTVPEGLVVANGGDLVGREARDGQVTWRYRSRGPAPFLLLAIAQYELVERDGIRVFAFSDDRVGAGQVVESASRAIDRYRRIFGPIGRPMDVTVIEIPDDWGSQASLAGGIIQEAAAFRDVGQRRQLYHELSHLWNAVDLDAPSPRWNEGLAMFLQGRLSRELDGWDGEAEALEAVRARLLEQCRTSDPCGRTRPRDFGRARLTDHAYSVGRLMFTALYVALGESAFDEALRRHRQSHPDGTRTDDLVAAFVAVGGSAARRVFDEWLDSTVWLTRLRQAESARALLESYRSARQAPKHSDDGTHDEDVQQHVRGVGHRILSHRRQHFQRGAEPPLVEAEFRWCRTEQVRPPPTVPLEQKPRPVCVSPEPEDDAPPRERGRNQGRCDDSQHDIEMFLPVAARQLIPRWDRNPLDEL